MVFRVIVLVLVCLLTSSVQAQRKKKLSKKEKRELGMLPKTKDGKPAPVVNTKGWVWNPESQQYEEYDKGKGHTVTRHNWKKWKKKKGKKIVKNRKAIRAKRKARKKQGLGGGGDDKTLSTGDKKKK